MEYSCQKVSVSRLAISTDGVVESLCNVCQSKDCSNPIMYHQVSIFGVTKKNRVYVRNGEPYIIVNCEGFTNDKL